MRVKTLTAQTSNPRKSQLSRRVSTEGSHSAFRSKVVTLQRETTMVAKPTHTLQRVWRPISYASTTVLEQTWQLEPKGLRTTRLQHALQHGHATLFFTIQSVFFALAKASSLSKRFETFNHGAGQVYPVNYSVAWLCCSACCSHVAVVLQ